MKRRLVRSVLAALVAMLVSWPMIGFTATVEGGPVWRFEPSWNIGKLVLGIGVGYTLWLWLWQFLPRAAAARVVVPVVSRPAVRWGGAALLLAALVVVPLATMDGHPRETAYWLGIALETMVFAVIALGLNISMGMAGLLVLGHAAFWAVGAYTFTMLTLHAGWNFWIAFPAGGLAAALVGLLLGLPSLRLRGDYLAIVTLGFGEAIRWVIKNNSAWTGGDAGIPGSEVDGSIREARGFLGRYVWQPGTGSGSSVVLDCYWFALGLLLVCVICIALLSRSRFGRALYALREDETAARCMGIDTTRVKLIAFMASAMWAGLAGAVHPVFRGQITPQLFDFNASVLFVSIVVLGGLGSIPGTIFGAIILNVLPTVLRNQFPEFQDYRMLVYGCILTAMMVVRPEGLFGRSAHGEGADDGGERPAAVPVAEAAS